MKIQYIPTGNIFDLPKEECKRIYEESPFNYKILDGVLETKENKTPKSTVANKVLGGDDDVNNEKKNIYKSFTVAELKALCDSKKIEYDAKNDKKADLIEHLLKSDEKKEEKGETENAEGEKDGQNPDNNADDKKDGETENAEG